MKYREMIEQLNAACDPGQTTLDDYEVRVPLSEYSFVVPLVYITIDHVAKTIDLTEE